MNKKLLITIGLAAIVITVVFFVRFGSQSTNKSELIDLPKLPLTIPLSALNNSGESGTATITEVEGKTVITVVINNMPPDVRLQPMNIHTGSCSNLGGVKSSIADYISKTHYAESTLRLSPKEFLAELPLAITVSKSPDDSKIYVACGDIKI